MLDDEVYAAIAARLLSRDWFEQIKPDVVVAHWPFDTHPNHHVVGSLAWLCYKKEGGWNLYFYEVYTDIQSLGFRPDVYLDVEPVIETKKKAIDCIVSQTPAELWETHEKMHHRRGKECGRERAEAYFLVEARRAVRYCRCRSSRRRDDSGFSARVGRDTIARLRGRPCPCSSRHRRQAVARIRGLRKARGSESRARRLSCRGARSRSRCAA
ncbi:MAG: PIG-L family deacetylase [Phycisphaerae bacterium]|nr:PIG-L family deacetylase [Phycisphaerae bacterium]